MVLVTHMQCTSLMAGRKRSYTFCSPLHSQLGTRRRSLRPRVANPRHDDNTDANEHGSGAWNEPDQALSKGVDWAKVQSLAALTGASTLAAVVIIQLTGKADLATMAFENIPEPLQEALPQKPGSRNKGPQGPFDIGSVVQNIQVGSNDHSCLNIGQHGHILPYLWPPNTECLS